jgi:DNA invertase Pin-like site-specific DNA recombinase
MMNELVSNPQTGPIAHSLLLSSKIQPKHLEKLALIYVRQSSQKQVEQNIESTQLQYRLAGRAEAYGWQKSRVEIIDCDLGISGKSIEGRTGFQRLLAEVSLGHVGVVMGIEMSRLARSCRDWHHLLELCAMFNTLLADADGIYDPREQNDRLLLGLKGTMSEAELYVLRGRLRSGQLNKARRGEMFTHAPIGYVRSGDSLAKDPDDQARAVVELLFTKFQELQSASGVLRYFFDHGIKIGCRDHRGANKGQLVWKALNQSTLTGILHHPVYAGAYVYGRREVNPSKMIAGQPSKGRRWGKPEDWDVLMRDRLPAYITWQRWQENQDKLKENSSRYGGSGAARGGSLLASRVRCLRCGCRMSICYAGSSNARFTCDALRNHLRQSQCQSFNAKPLHDLIEQQLLIAISPASISLSIEAVRKLESDVALLEKNHRQNIERSTFQSDLARCRYEEVDPSNRLVAAELERRWEASLCKQREAEEALNRLRQEKQNRLNASDIAKIESLSNDIPNLWRQASTSSIDKQTIARTLIEEVSVGVVQDNERVDVTIRWTGGYESRHQILRAVGNFGQLECADAIKQRIVKLKRQGHCHEAVASELNQQGYRSAQQQPFTKAIVSQLCRQFQSSGTSCEAIGGYEDCWLIGQLSQRLAVSVSTLRNWLSRNWLATIRTGERWIIWADEKELNRLKALADYQRGPHCRATPESLTTPRKPV